MDTGDVGQCGVHAVPAVVHQVSRPKQGSAMTLLQVEVEKTVLDPKLKEEVAMDHAVCFKHCFTYNFNNL